MKPNIEAKLNFKLLYVLIVTRNNIDLSIDMEILYVGIIYLFIKYQYGNAYFS